MIAFIDVAGGLRCVDVEESVEECTHSLGHDDHSGFGKRSSNGWDCVSCSGGIESC